MNCDNKDCCANFKPIECANYAPKVAKPTRVALGGGYYWHFWFNGGWVSLDACPPPPARLLDTDRWWAVSSIEGAWCARPAWAIIAYARANHAGLIPDPKFPWLRWKEGDEREKMIPNGAVPLGQNPTNLAPSFYRDGQVFWVASTSESLPAIGGKDELESRARALGLAIAKPRPAKPFKAGDWVTGNGKTAFYVDEVSYISDLWRWKGDARAWDVCDGWHVIKEAK